MAYEGHIIALGGGGFSEDDHGVDDYILAQARAARPKVAFVGTATGDSTRYIDKFQAAFRDRDCEPTHLPFFGRTPELRSFVREQDVIYVGGGNTRSLLAVWREWGLPDLLREAWEAGTVLAGISAGAICWFEQGLTDSAAGSLGRIDCIGLLPGSCSPHYHGEKERIPAYHALIHDGRMAPGLGIDDRAAVHFVGTEPHRIISSRAEATAYRVEVADGRISEVPLDVERIDLQAV